MTTQEFSQFILNGRPPEASNTADESAIQELAQLISGSLIYRLYKSLITNGYDMEEVSDHLQMLCDTGNYYGLLYFVFMLTDATNEALPPQFADLAANQASVPYLASALMEDWLDFHEDYEE